jgi:hypothetical protein
MSAQLAVWGYAWYANARSTCGPFPCETVSVSYHDAHKSSWDAYGPAPVCHSLPYRSTCV